MSMVRHWQRFPREDVDGPSLQVLKAGLDGALSMGGGLERDDL